MVYSIRHLSSSQSLAQTINLCIHIRSNNREWGLCESKVQIDTIEKSKDELEFLPFENKAERIDNGIIFFVVFSLSVSSRLSSSLYAAMKTETLF